MISLIKRDTACLEEVMNFCALHMDSKWAGEVFLLNQYLLFLEVSAMIVVTSQQPRGRAVASREDDK